MSTKKFGSVVDTLAPLADELPVQRTPKQIIEKAEEGRALERKQPSRKPKKVDELIVQYPLKLRATLRDQLAQKAALEGMTMRGFIMSALKEKGIDVTDDDMVDRRKK